MGLYKSTRIRRLADGTKRKEKSRNWHGAYTHPKTGRRVHLCLKTADKSAAKQILAKLMTDAALDDAGLGDRFKGHEKRALRDHADDWRAVLLSDGNTSLYADTQRYRAVRVVDGCNFRRWSDIDANAVRSFLGELRTSGQTKRRKVAGLSARTRNYYVQAFKQFCDWLTESERAGAIYLKPVKRQKFKKDRRHVRRAYRDDEVRRFLEAARSGPVRFGMAPESRYWLYRLALETGLRSSELRSLRWSSFILDGDGSTVTLDAAFSKNGDDATLPLRDTTAALLKRWRDDCGDDGFGTVFADMPHVCNVVRMLREDQAVAEIQYRDAAGRIADFHSLRRTFATNLVRAGVDPKTVQKLMRHSTITLTMDLYAEVDAKRLAGAVNALPEVEAATLRLTG